MADPALSRLTRALRHRNYRLFFGGQSISLVGTWITRVATSWLVYRFTGSELLLARGDRLRGRVMAFYTMAFFGAVPIRGLIAGVAASRTGSQWTIALCGLVAVATGLWFAPRLLALRAIVHPIYQERRIMLVPAVDTGAKTL